MPNIPRILQDQQVGGPAQTKEATLEDFTPGWRQVDTAVRTSGAAAETVYAQQAHADKAIADLGDTLQGLTDQAAKATRLTKLHAAKTDAITGIQEYAAFLKNGRANDDGSTTPAPLPGQRVQMYKQYLDGVGTKYAKQLDPASLAVFKNDIAEVALRQGLDVQSNVIEDSKLQNKANLQDQLETLGQKTANTPAKSRALLLDEGRLAIQDQVAAGTLNPEEARNMLHGFVKTVSTADLRHMMGTEQAVNLLKKETVPGLNADEQAHWLNSAITAWNANLTKNLAAQQHAEMQAEKQRKQGQEDQYGKRVVEEDKKLLIPETVQDDITNKRLNPEKGEALLHRLRVGDPVKDDPMTAVGLDKLAGRVTSPKDLDTFREAAASAYTQTRQITWETYKTLEKKAQDSLNSPDFPAWYRQGKEYIASQIGGEKPVDQGVAAKQGQVINDFEKWTQENSKVDRDVAEKVYKRMADSGRILAGSTVDLEAPNYSVKTKDGKLDPVATLNATQKAFQENKLTLSELNIQAARIRQWGERQALMKQREAASSGPAQ